MSDPSSGVIYPPLSATGSSLRPSATLAINERSNALIAEGREIFKFGLGQSPFPVPDVVVQALRDRAHEKDYLPVKGLLPLREAISKWHRERDGIDCCAEDIIIGPGSKELMFLLQLVHKGPLTLPSPSWVSYEPQADIIGKKVEWIETRREDGGRLTANGLSEKCRLNPGPRVLILNYPNNPTGLTYSDSALRGLAEVARKHRVTVISDEIYGEVNHNGEHISIATVYPEGSVISSGLSKWCGAGGWRLGYMVFPSNLRHLLDALASAASETYTSVSAPIQWASIKAFENDETITRYLLDSRRILSALGRYIYGRLSSTGVSIEPPEGGFYMFPNMEHIKKSLSSYGVKTSSQMCEALLNDTGVATLPGSCFGRCESELSLRLSYVNFDGANALREVSKLPTDATLDDNFLREVCGRSIEAADRIARWIEDHM